MKELCLVLDGFSYYFYLYPSIFSELPRSELPLLVATLCCLVVINRFCEQAWSVARNLLNSQLGEHFLSISIRRLP